MSAPMRCDPTLERAPLKTFSDVFEAELAEIKTRRAKQFVPAEAGEDPRQTLVGLALSGGGIRSATFCLGLLQGFARHHVLRVFDYVSTVSGGGFAGGWWSAWLSRSPTPPNRLFPDEERIEPTRGPGYVEGRPDAAVTAGHDPVHHLRLFANYLTPRKGLLSGDTWRAAAVVSRNLLLTWLILLPLLFGTILAGQLYYVIQPFSSQVVLEFTTASGPTSWTARALVGLRPVLALLFMLAVVTLLWMRFNNAGRRETHATASIAVVLIVVAMTLAIRPPSSEAWPGLAELVTRRLADLVLAALTAAAAVWVWLRLTAPANGPTTGADGQPSDRPAKSSRATAYHATLLVASVGAATVLGFSGFAHELVERVWADVTAGTITFKNVASAVTLVSTLFGALFTALRAAPAGGRDPRDVAPPSLPSRIVFSLTPPLVLIVLGVLSAALSHRLLATLMTPLVYPRLAALTAAAFAGVAVCVVFAAYEVGRDRETPTAIPAGAERVSGLVWFTVAAAAGAFGVLLWKIIPNGPARNLLPDPVGVVSASAIIVGAALVVYGRATDTVADNRRIQLVLVFAVAAVVLLSLTIALYDVMPERGLRFYAGLALLVVTGGWVVALGWMADPNVLSLHGFYKARLVRAYLGASNATRAATKRITDAVPNDDVLLRQLAPTAVGGPYHLINTTLNLVGGGDLATAQRSAASFVLSSGHCGSVRTGYRPTREYMAGGLTLGAAIAASGAAVSPNMGSQTPGAALAMLLTLLNVRLGFWAPTPHRARWRTPQTRLWPFYLLRESFSQTNDVTSYCYLTDGGHFDNTGVYSLVERGCRYIVVCDNGADPRPSSFEDVGTAVRRCRIDFGTEFTKLEIESFGTHAGGATVHYAVGEIRYSEAHARLLGWTDVSELARSGLMVWFKPCLITAPGGVASDETVDVRQYGLQHTIFPQQSTADQWFDEAQFESYRKLGELSAQAALAKALAKRPGFFADLAKPEATMKAEEVAKLFAAL